MSNLITTFERKEIKYRLDPDQYRDMRALISPQMAPDAYGRSKIVSVYFDTPEHEIVMRSLEKPLYKEKLRLRTYGDPSPDGLAFLELKVKYDGIVYKRRVAMTYAAARAYMSEGFSYEEACASYPVHDPLEQSHATSARSLQIAHEIDSFRKRHAPLVPSMEIIASRVAWAPTVIAEELDPLDTTPGVRITFDDRISYSDLMVDRENAHHYEQAGELLSKGEAVMEIKVPGAMPLWLVDALDRCEARPTSFSKYGKAFVQLYGNESGVRQAALRAQQIETLEMQREESGSGRHGGGEEPVRTRSMRELAVASAISQGR